MAGTVSQTGRLMPYRQLTCFAIRFLRRPQDKRSSTTLRAAENQQLGASSTSTGAWSLGRSCLRGSLSITQATTEALTASETKM